MTRLAENRERPDDKKKVGDHDSTVREQGESEGLDEGNQRHVMTRTEGIKAHRRNRSTKWSATGFDDEDDNGD